LQVRGVEGGERAARRPMKVVIPKLTQASSRPSSSASHHRATPVAAGSRADRSALGPHLGAAAGSSPVQLQRHRKRWTPAQQAQSDRFWAKKNARVAARQESQAVNTRRRQARAEAATWLSPAQELEQVRRARLVRGPEGTGMPNRTRALVPPKPEANVGYSGLVERIGGFLHPQHPVRSLFNEGGPQLIQEFNDGQHDVTRRVGVDVEPSSHVAKLKPHLNLQTQHGGAIQGGLLADPHLPLADTDPFARHRQVHGLPVHGQHPLYGLQPEERRQFIERYLRSSGTPLTRA
jgi:hypothetical protein